MAIVTNKFIHAGCCIDHKNNLFFIGKINNRSIQQTANEILGNPLTAVALGGASAICFCTGHWIIGTAFAIGAIGSAYSGFRSYQKVR